MGLDEEGTLAALRTVRHDVVDPTIAEHGGRIVRTMGDGLLVEFNSVVDPVRCAIAIQRAMPEQGADTRLIGSCVSASPSTWAMWSRTAI